MKKFKVGTSSMSNLELLNEVARASKSFGDL